MNKYCLDDQLDLVDGVLDIILAHILGYLFSVGIGGLTLQELL